jgi:hypothetical protein
VFVITDCLGRPVGRPQGYAKHSTAQRLAEGRGSIKTRIWEAYHTHWDQPTRQGADGTRLVYRIEWVDRPSDN